ncbi:outer membrane protein [Catalinimonas alkaloidigena]|uniref:Outer membrane protein n=1 Tax=Catalinimonas alkaloidigena TaxID=1075417 RepID=A0A1G8X147_9BACT|nr:TolC family protein [Catalinimonas alkaloidigena]SDJ84369.1 outer membrane protein [Catalinimonas alkaloidigena]
MHSLRTFFFLLVVPLLGWRGTATAQQPDPWTLEAMIRYATENNLQVKQAALTTQSYAADYTQAKASRLPSLNASGTQTLTAGRSIDPVTSDFVAQNVYATSLNANASFTLYNGGKINNTIKANALQVKSGELSTEEARNDITVALTQAYLQALYYRESIAVAEGVRASSAQQLERTEALFSAGSASAQERAQLKSQYANDQASVITAQNQYNQQILILKQLLELGIGDALDIAIPDLPEDLDLAITPKQQAYNNAIQALPEVKNSALNVQIAEYQLKQAQAGYLPTLSLSGSLGTGYTNVQDFAYFAQFNNNFNQRAGVTLSIPIFDRKVTATSVQKAQIQIQSANLEVINTHKQIWQTLETTYQDLTSSLSQLEVAQLQQEAADESYKLAAQQFQLGMLTTADFILAKSDYQTAEQSYLQAKYTALMNYQLYEFYQGHPIQL